MQTEQGRVDGFIDAIEEPSKIASFRIVALSMLHDTNGVASWLDRLTREMPDRDEAIFDPDYWRDYLTGLDAGT